MSQASAIEYDASEGPTKADYGEHDDEATVIREDRSKNGWVNPLSLTDDGADDEMFAKRAAILRMPMGTIITKMMMTS